MVENRGSQLPSLQETAASSQTEVSGSITQQGVKPGRLLGVFPITDGFITLGWSFRYSVPDGCGGIYIFNMEYDREKRRLI